MKKINFLYIFLFTIALLNSSFIDNNSKFKQEDPKKAKQQSKKEKLEEIKKQKLEEAKIAKLEESKKAKLEELGKLRSDSIKKIKVVTVTEELSGDSLVIYKGKFMPFKKKAHASYYNDKFHGRRTASGKVYDKNKLTAAHKRLPFGTKVKVTNEVNGKSVVVEITDRGPFVKGREIDLSRKAFMAISGGSGSGAVIATLEVLQN